MLFTNFGSCELKISVTAIAGLGLICGSSSVQAQVIGDRITNTQVKVNGNISHIVGGMKAGKQSFS